MKFIKISLYVLAGILLVGVVGAGIFIVSFDANEYRPQISQQVKKQTGRDFVLGDIKPSVFPWLGMELQQLALGNAKGFKVEQMLVIERLDARMALLPLLMGEVRVDTLRVHGLKVSLSRNSEGKTNWDDILDRHSDGVDDKADASGQALEQAKEVKEEPDGGRSPLSILMVNGIDIKDASIQWDDALTNQSVALEKFNLQTGAIRSGEKFPVNMSSHIRLSEQQASFDLGLQTEVDFKPEPQLLKLEQLKLKIDGKIEKMEISLVQLNLDTHLDADLKNQIFKLPNLALEINAQGKPVPGGKFNAKINIAAVADLVKQLADVNSLSIKTMGLDMQSQLAVTQLMDAPSVKGQFKLAPFNPANLMKQLAIALPEMQGKDALQSASAAFDFTAGVNKVKLKKLVLKLDQSNITGELGVSQFDKPAIAYHLSLDEINLDNYLPPEKPVPQNAAQKAPTNDKPAAVAIEDTPIDLPVTMLRDLNVEGVFKATTVQGFKQSIKDINLQTQAKGGVIKLSNIKASLLGGNIGSSVTLDVRKNTPRYVFKLKGKDLEADSVASPIIQDMLGEKDVRLTGASNLDVDINTRGQSVKKLMANTNGLFKFNMGEAELHEVDIEYYARQAVVAYMEEKKFPVKERLRGEYTPKNTTALRVVRATANIKNGVIDNRDLLLDSPRFKVTGAGKVNLALEQLNYRAVIDINPATKKTTGEKIADVPMPVFVKGSFVKPDIRIDKKTWLKGVGNVATSEAKKAVKEKTDTKVKALKEKTRDKLKDKFKGLFR